MIIYSLHFSIMKQTNIVRSKMWDALSNKKDAVFPAEFYSQLDILKGIGGFDLKNVSINIRFGKTDKKFPAYIITFIK